MDSLFDLQTCFRYKGTFVGQGLRSMNEILYHIVHFCIICCNCSVNIQSFVLFTPQLFALAPLAYILRSQHSAAFKVLHDKEANKNTTHMCKKLLFAHNSEKIQFQNFCFSVNRKQLLSMPLLHV